MTGPLGNSEFCFPRISLRFSGNKIKCSPRDQSLSVNYNIGIRQMPNHWSTVVVILVIIGYHRTREPFKNLIIFAFSAYNSEKACKATKKIGGI